MQLTADLPYVISSSREVERRVEHHQRNRRGGPQGFSGVGGLWAPTLPSGPWAALGRSVLFARDGAVPVCYDPTNRQLVVNFGKGWIPIPKD